MTALQAAKTLPMPSAAPSLARRLADAAAMLGRWLQRSRSRDLLASLDERMLKDVGLTRADVVVETDKPFWRE